LRSRCSMFIEWRCSKARTTSAESIIEIESSKIKKKSYPHRTALVPLRKKIHCANERRADHQANNPLLNTPASRVNNWIQANSRQIPFPWSGTRSGAIQWMDVLPTEGHLVLSWSPQRSLENRLQLIDVKCRWTILYQSWLDNSFASLSLHGFRPILFPVLDTPETLVWLKEFWARRRLYLAITSFSNKLQQLKIIQC